MDVKEYIASGILELYAMGTLPPEEMREVEKMAAEYPELAAELRQVQDALGTYSTAYSRNPSPKVRAEVMKIIKSSPEARRGKVVSMRSPHELTYKYLIAACIASLIISTFASIFFYQKWSDAEDRNVALLNDKNQMAQSLNMVRLSYEKLSSEMAIVDDPAMTIITLNATDSTKYYKANIFWNKYTRQTWLNVADLPVPAPDKQYQLWALVGGQPVDAGVFTMDYDSGMQRMKMILNADAWAVTLEPKGGSAAPTLDQMYLISKI